MKNEEQLFQKFCQKSAKNDSQVFEYNLHFANVESFTGILYRPLSHVIKLVLNLVLQDSAKMKILTSHLRQISLQCPCKKVGNLC